LGSGNWKDHPELVRLRENVLKRKVSAEEVARIKKELEEERKVVPVVRVVEEKKFNADMTIRVRWDAVPVLRGTRGP